MKNIEFLKSLFRMTEKQLKLYTAKKLKETYPSVIVGDGYVFAKGTFPVLLVAHLDTVHTCTPTVITYLDNGNKISSPQGIGGDDRCGVYAVLEVIKKFNCSVLFCEQEEIGGIGARKFTEAEFAKDLKFNYIIEFDRKGSNDAVFYDCDNPEFTEFITKEFYKESFGSFSDISTIAPFLGCAAVNLSCGYYNAHTKSEYVVVSELEDSINAACNILARTTEDDKFEYIECKYSYYNKTYSYNGWYNSKKENYYIIEYQDENGNIDWYDTMAKSHAEAIGKFCINNPSLSYRDIIDVCVDTGTYV